MPNPGSENNGHQFYSVDGSFPKDFLNLESPEPAQLTEELLNSKIKHEIYGMSENQSPHYYEGSHITSEFRAFKKTEEGKNSISQIENELKICFQKLSEWSKSHALEVMIYGEDEQTGRQIPLNQSVDNELVFFYDRLIKGDFSDRVIAFYTDGKKAIETLSLMIQDPRIDLVFRQHELINLAADGNLRMCADGCFSRFTTAADALKNYGNLAISTLKNKFIRFLAEESAKKRVYQEGIFISYSNALCILVKVNPIGNEIHAQNFLINTLLKKFDLETLKIKDEFVDHLIVPHQDEHTKALFNQFFKEFATEFRVNRFIQFIKNKYYQSKNIEFILGEFKVPDEMQLSEDLKVLGEDPGFGMAEVLSYNEDNEIFLKEQNALTITLTERMYNQNVLDATQKCWQSKFTLMSNHFKKNGITFFPVTSETHTQNFRIVPGNIELTWLKDEEGDRVLLLECLEHISNCLDLLKGWVSDKQVESLFIDVNDLTQFFTKLPAEQHTGALRWMRQNKVVFEGVLLKEIIFNELLNYRPWCDDFLYYIENNNKLFSNLSTEALFELIKQLSPKFINRLLITYIDVLNGASPKPHSKLAPAIIEFVRFLRKGKFKNFSSLKFKSEFWEWINQAGDSVTFLKDIDFSYINFEKIESYASFEDLNFEGSRLKDCIIIKDVIRTNFKKANGRIIINGVVNQVDFSDSSLNIHIEGEVRNSCFQKLSGNILIAGDFHESTASDLKGKFKLYGRAYEADFQNVDGEIEIKGELDEVNFNYARGTFLALNGEIKNCDLHAIEFDKIKVSGKIINSYLTSIDFTETIFIAPGTHFDADSNKVFEVEFEFDKEKNGHSESFFQDSQFSTTSLTQLLDHPSMNNFLVGNQELFLLRGTKLNKVDFMNEDLRTLMKRFYLIDFEGASLPFAKFDYFLQDDSTSLYQLKFKNANLQGASFVNANLVNAIFEEADLSNCDLSTANTKSMGVKGAKINNLRLRCDQLFSFYEQGHRDFSTVSLVGTLENVELSSSIAGSKLSSQAFKYLKEQGFKNINEADLTVVFDEKRGSQDYLLFEENEIHPLEKKVSVVNICLDQKASKRKREIECLFNEDDVKQFINQESEEILINSERFIDKLKSAPEDQREQLIDFAVRYPTAGTKKDEVKKLIQLRQWQRHFSKVNQVSNLISKGLITKNTLISFLNGNYEDTAINLGFLGGISFLGKFSKKLEAMGEDSLLKGKTLLGNGLKTASPFFKRGTSAFMVYDLVQAVKEFNPNDSATLVRVVGDSIYIGADIAEIGIELAEIFGVFEGVSAITGPIGEVIGVIVFLGTDIYQAVQKVKQIDEMMHLTVGEKFREGVRAFLGMSIDGYLQDLIHQKQFFEEVIKQKWGFLREHSTIQKYFFSTEKPSCRMVRHKQADSYDDALNDRDGTNWHSTEVCDQLGIDLDNQIFLDKSKDQRTFSRAKPDMPESSDLLCFPSGPEGSTALGYSCENAIGIGDPNPKDGNYTLINIGEGEDTVRGFIETPNIIMAGNGYKHLIGGDQNDIFFLNGDLIRGYISGESGNNTLDLGDFAPNRGYIQIGLGEKNSYLVHDGYGFNALRMDNFQYILTRKEKTDHIYPGCSTRYVDGRGGYSKPYGQDVIVIDTNQECHYQMQIKVSPYTVISNQANRGDFSYLVTRGIGDAEIYFKTQGKDTAQHQISFNYTLAEIKQIHLLPDNKVIFNLMSEPENEFTVILSRSNNTLISCIFTDAEMKLGKERTYTLQQSKKTPNEIVHQYPALTERLQGSIVVHAQNQIIVLGYPHHHDVLQNDPLHRSHLVGNRGENIYKLTLRQDEKKTRNIILYPPQPHSKKIETLDLRSVFQKVEGHKMCVPYLRVQKKGNNLHLLIKAKVNKRCKSGKKFILRIILKNAAKIRWASQLNILAHQSPLEINQVAKNKGRHHHNVWVLSPKPLVFDKAKKIIVLSAQDVEPHTQIMLPEIPGGVAFARTGEYLNDLVIIGKQINQTRTVLIKDFYFVQGRDAHKLLSLSLHFGNLKVKLKDIPGLELPSMIALQDREKEKIYNAIFGSNNTNQIVMKAGSSWVTLVGFGSAVALSIAYLCIKNQRRQSGRALENAAVVALLAAVASPQTHATPILPETEMVVCSNQFFNGDQCAKSQILMGTLIFCANYETGLAWFKGEKGYDSVYAVSSSTPLDIFEPRAFGDHILIRREDHCQQSINLKEMTEVSSDLMVANPIFQEILKKPLEQYRRTRAWDPFKHQVKQMGLLYFGEKCLIHTNLGDYFRVVGLTPNWQQQDAGHWSSRIVRSWFNHNLLSSGSITGVCLETALVHPSIQSTLPGDTYRSKLIIRFIADLLQFGPSVSTCIPSLVDFLCYQHPWSYEITMGLRGSLALLEVINDRSIWHLTVALFILPQIPYWLEHIGIPVTRYLSHALETLERFLISYSLLLSVQEDSQRVAAKNMVLQEADQRVEQGKKQIAWVYNSGLSFFSQSKTSKAQTNDADLPNSHSTQASRVPDLGFLE